VTLRPFASTVLALALALPAAARADTAALVREQCAGCHSLAAPAAAAPDPAERAARKGPPLHYAGNKYQRDWLVAWLQEPAPIRPAGVFPPAHVRTTPEGDVVDAKTLPSHPKLGAAQAEAVADHLMQLRPYDERLAAQGYQPGPIALRLGQMNFAKFKGCDACHRDAAERGGVSGPELYTAWKRLQPAFLASFIADPVAWDPSTLMPKGELSEAEVAKLANYLKALAEAQP
jgi:mono/diheme cytochrome c family protein